MINKRRVSYTYRQIASGCAVKGISIHIREGNGDSALHQTAFSCCHAADYFPIKAHPVPLKADYSRKFLYNKEKNKLHFKFFYFALHRVNIRSRN